MNSLHARTPNFSTGPAVFLESRTAAPAPPNTTSTQSLVILPSL